MALDRALAMGLGCWGREEQVETSKARRQGRCKYLCHLEREDRSQDRAGNGLEAGTSGGAHGQ